jgi:hypothetical protein
VATAVSVAFFSFLGLGGTIFDMPRIEVILLCESEEPSPTHDLCCKCARGLKDGIDVQKTVLADLYHNDHFTIPAKVGSVDVEHPEYKPGLTELGDYICEVCTTTLGTEDE